MGVDPKRPLVGFALVAVLCAALMSLSVGQGWGTDIFGPGRPIAPSAAGGHLDRVVAPTGRPSAVSIPVPAELSAQPLGVADSNLESARTTSPGSAADDASEPVREAETAGSLAGEAERKVRRAAGKVDRRVHRAAGKVAREAERAAVKATRQAQRAAGKAVRQAERAAVKAARQAQRAADKAVRQAERAAATLASAAQRAAEKAVKAAEKAARKG